MLEQYRLSEPQNLRIPRIMESQSSEILESFLWVHLGKLECQKLSMLLAQTIGILELQDSEMLILSILLCWHLSIQGCLNQNLRNSGICENSDSYNLRILQCWILAKLLRVRASESQSLGILDSRKLLSLESQSIGILETQNPRILESQNSKMQSLRIL